MVPLFWPRKRKGLGLADESRDYKNSLAIASAISLLWFFYAQQYEKLIKKDMYSHGGPWEQGYGCDGNGWP